MVRYQRPIEIADTPEEVKQDKKARSRGNDWKKISNNFGTPSKNIKDTEKEKDPQERSEYLK